MMLSLSYKLVIASASEVTQNRALQKHLSRLLRRVASRNDENKAPSDNKISIESDPIDIASCNDKSITPRNYEDKATNKDYLLPSLLQKVGFITILVFVFSDLCWALPEDRHQVLKLSADSADLSQQTHRGEYNGHVQLDQGSSHLRAANAVTQGNEQNKLVLAIAKGKGKEQAHFWTLTALDKPPLHAYADVIRYHPEAHLIELMGNARVEQGNNSFSAPQISYDTIKQHVVSKSDGKSRTTIIIHSEK